MTIQLNNVRGHDYALTTDHPASSYGLPILLDSDGTPFGYADAVGDDGMRAGTMVKNWALWARDMLSSDELDFIEKFTNTKH